MHLFFLGGRVEKMLWAIAFWTVSVKLTMDWKGVVQHTSGQSAGDGKLVERLGQAEWGCLDRRWMCLIPWEYPPKWSCSIIGKLVGGLEHFLFFPYIGNNNPSWLIWFRGVETTNQEKGDYSSALEIVTTMFRKTLRYSDDSSDRVWATPELATARWMWHLVDKWYRQAVWGAGSKSINFYAL